jgi:hypothetical protein
VFKSFIRASTLIRHWSFGFRHLAVSFHAFKRFTSLGRTYIVLALCRFIFQREAGETLCARNRLTALAPSVPHAFGCARGPTGTSAIFLPAS